MGSCFLACFTITFTLISLLLCHESDLSIIVSIPVLRTVPILRFQCAAAFLLQLMNLEKVTGGCLNKYKLWSERGLSDR